MKKEEINLGDIEYPKIAYHPERTSEWIKKGDCFPVYIEISPTDVCNHNCVFCALDYLERQNLHIDTNVMIRALKEMAECGVKSVMFAGEGEPLLHKDICLFVQKAKEFGMDVSITTNGIFFNKEKIEQCLPNLSWIKFSIDAGTPENYSQIHGTDARDFDRVINNIKESVDFKNKNSLNVTIGTQSLIIPQNKDTIEKLAEILKEIGADYLVLKPYSKHPCSINNLVINPEDFNSLGESLEKFRSDEFKVLFRKETINRMMTEREYKTCYGLPFITLIDARGNIIPCNLFHGNLKFSYGNLNEQSFKDIWESDKRKKIITELAEKGISDCRLGCRLDPNNRFLHRLKNPKEHDNFI